MERKNDLFWILMMFIGFGLLWYIGTENRAESGRGWFLGSYNTSEKDEREVQGTTTKDIEEGIRDAQKDLEKVEREIARIQKEAKESPLSGILNLSSSGARVDSKEEYVKISVSSSLKQKSRITGLTLYSPMTGKSVVVGKAVILPRIGESNILQDVDAEPGDIVYVITGPSPAGMSFRTNKCAGYLTQYQDYSPELKRNCPTPENEALYLKTEPALTETCIDHINDLPRCEIPKKISSAPGTNCQNFLRSNLNYNACVSNHIGDPDFPGREWYVFLNQNKEIWKDENEIIQLLDKEGKIIDTVDY